MQASLKRLQHNKIIINKEKQNNKQFKNKATNW